MAQNSRKLVYRTPKLSALGTLQTITHGSGGKKADAANQTKK
jgi:hypothetical protein